MKISTLFAAFLLICFAFSDRAQAVVPVPDGAYPNFTTAEGQNALQILSTGAANTAVGAYSLSSISTGNFNTAVGAGALDLNTADSNTAIGTAALLLNTTGIENTANGTAALEFNETGNNNTATGAFALFSNTSAVGNTAVGDMALTSNTIGPENSAFGEFGLLKNTTGFGNTASGFEALMNNTTGNGNIGLGFQAGMNVTSANDVICIGDAVVGANVTGTCFIGSIRGVTTIHNDAVPVLIDSVGQLGTLSSSRRFKTEIKPIDKASESILALKPVSFRYKVHKDSTPQFGLIAEDVAAVNPNLVIYDTDGKPYTVRYDAVNAMLLNEFLKAHHKMEQQEDIIVSLQKQVTALAAGLQKVSAQLETNNSAVRVVNRNQ